MRVTLACFVPYSKRTQQNCPHKIYLCLKGIGDWSEILSKNSVFYLEDDNE